MYIGIDIGGTKIAAGIVQNGRIIKRISVPTGSEHGRNFVLMQLKYVVGELSKRRKIKGVGIGVPGLYKGTTVLALPHVSCIEGLDLKKVLGIKVPVILENDSRCFAMAEYKHGAAQGAKTAIGIILGTGVGSGIIVNGKLLHGATGNAGEIGHMIYDTKITSYTFGPGAGSWNHILNGSGLVRRHQQRGGTEDDPRAIWESQTSQARATREETVRLLTIFVASLCYAIDPDVIVFGGGLSNLPLTQEVNKLLPSYGRKPIVKQSALGSDAGILGAAAALK